MSEATPSRSFCRAGLVATLSLALWVAAVPVAAHPGAVAGIVMLDPGHFSQLEVPDQINGMIASFVRHYVSNLAAV
jgi:hypothetical protein